MLALDFHVLVVYSGQASLLFSSSRCLFHGDDVSCYVIMMCASVGNFHQFEFVFFSGKIVIRCSRFDESKLVVKS